jgi:Zn finger protein HypA/HybF involved in hydrogenase expression
MGFGELADPSKRCTRHDAQIVLDATQTVIGKFGMAVMRQRKWRTEKHCPKCGSHALDVGFEPELMPRPYIIECEHCGWQRQQGEEEA